MTLNNREFTDYAIQFLAENFAILLPQGVLQCKTRSLLEITDFYSRKKRRITPSELKTLFSNDAIRAIAEQQVNNKDSLHYSIIEKDSGASDDSKSKIFLQTDNLETLLQNIQNLKVSSLHSNKNFTLCLSEKHKLTELFSI